MINKKYVLKVTMIIILCTFCSIPASSSNIYAGGWTKKGEHWIFYDSGETKNNTWITTNNEWYHTDNKGIRQIGWHEIEGDLYYLREKETNQVDWAKIDEKWYYLMERGRAKIGWNDIADKRYYFGKDGSMQTDWKEVDGKTYYFGKDGDMQTGWQQRNEKWYFLGTDGSMQTGWLKQGNDWYYLTKDGSRATSFLEVSGQTYYFGEDGIMSKGWQKIDGGWHYLKEDGSMAKGWVKVKDKNYYLDETGKMVTGWLKNNDNTYYLNRDGIMLTGWQKIDGKGSYFKKDGRLYQLTASATKFVAHRGLSSLAPENSIPAFQLAGQQGFWGFECDVYETLDGNFVMTHESNIGRIAQVDKDVTQMTLEEIKQHPLVTGSNIQNYPGTTIPTLEETLQVLREYPNLNTLIEIKPILSLESIQKLVTAVINSGVQDRVEFISFSKENLEKIRQVNNTIKMQLLVGKPGEDVIGWCKTMKSGVNVYNGWITENFVKQCHDQGIRVNSYTVNAPEVAYKQIDLFGIDYLTTDNKLYQ